MRWIGCLLLVCGISATPVSAQIKRFAETGCLDGQPHTRWLAGFDSSSVQGQILMAHERVHQRQLQSDAAGTCEEKLARILADPDALVAAEAEAYCYQANFAAQLLHGDPQSWYRSAVDVLYSAVYPKVDRVQVLAVFRRYCPLSEVVQ